MVVHVHLLAHSYLPRSEAARNWKHRLGLSSVSCCFSSAVRLSGVPDLEIMHQAKARGAVPDRNNVYDLRPHVVLYFVVKV